MEPTTAATGFAVSKIYYGLASLVTAMAVLFMRKNPTLNGRGRVATAAIVSGVSVGFGVTFGGMIAIWLGMRPDDANVALAIGGGIGLFSFTVVKLLANKFDKWDEKDIVEVAQELRTAVAQKPSDATSKAPVARKSTRKTPAKKAPKQ